MSKTYIDDDLNEDDDFLFSDEEEDDEQPAPTPGARSYDKIEEKRGRPKGKNAQRLEKAMLSDGTELGKIPKGNKERMRKNNSGKHVVSDKPYSTETGIGYEDHEVTDNYDKVYAFPPPSKHPEFRKFWVENIQDLTSRKDFNPSHLGLFEVYCRLRVELRRLDDFIMTNGHVFRVVTFAGEVRRVYPEVAERHKVIAAIARYATLLKLAPSRSKTPATASEEEQDEWN